MAIVDLKSDLSMYRKDVPIAQQTPKDVPMHNEQGIAKLESQLGAGTPFKYLKDGALSEKKFSTSGYHTKRKYGNLIQSVKDQTDKSLLASKAEERNSPSALDEEYKKYNLRDDSYNPTYIRHPLILRGLQRRSNPNPQRWGYGSGAGFDDGLIRGGVVTTVDRTIEDTVRIAKFMASPKGLLWIVKQVGLGLTNPKVETISGAPFGATRLHSGIASLLSVPGTPLGLHFTTHGIPFQNEVASYGNVQIAKSLIYKVTPKLGNRLAQLRSDLNVVTNSSTGLLNGKGMSIVSLSGLAGPQSVYGIGLTNIFRTVDTRTDAVDRAHQDSNFIATYQAGKSYLASIRANTNNPNDTTDSLLDSVLKVKNFTVRRFDDGDGYKDSLKTITTANESPFKEDLSTAKTRESSTPYKDAKTDGINNYMVMSYSQIPKDKKSFNDFRSIISNDSNPNAQETGLLGGADINNYYTNNNLETRYGFGKLGQISADKQFPTGKGSFIVDSTKFTGKESARKVLLVDKFRGDRVTALDINTTGNIATKDIYETAGSNKAEDLIKFYFEDGVEGNSVMPFRCTMTGLTDSFTPGWDRIEIMGRPEGAYLYHSFERNISFSFIVAALSRSEMIPMWRKLNYLASYTMPDYHFDNAKPAGPFMRITIGDLFQQTPGFIESLTYTVPDEASWDIAADVIDNPDAKQLPMMVEAQITYRIISDYRPSMLGRVYSLSDKNKSKNAPGQWLSDATPKK